MKRYAVMNLLSEAGGTREPVAVRWFDLDVVAMPDPSHADGIILEAQQRPDTLVMLKQQQEGLCIAGHDIYEPTTTGGIERGTAGRLAHQSHGGLQFPGILLEALAVQRPTLGEVLAQHPRGPLAELL